MAQFNLKRFLESPSLELLESCQKDDLAQISAHFCIYYLRQFLKKELRNLVVEKLVELGVLVFSEISVSSVAQPALTSAAVAQSEALSSDEGGKKVLGKPPAVSPDVDAEVGVGIKTPYTLPRFNPLSDASSLAGSK
ncbi:hypothetical protein CHARACLAT_029145, partial [Characodon lateralis]|nr:hypothetical protein [Characodon lateralis]